MYYSIMLGFTVIKRAPVFVRFSGLLLAIFAVCLLGGCASPETTSVVSSAGTIGPRLTPSLPRNQPILVLSALRDIPIDIISENIFVYYKLGSTTLPAAFINPFLIKNMTAILSKKGYQSLDSAALNTPNVLNTTNIQLESKPPNNALSVEAQQFLAKIIERRKVERVVLLTQNSGSALVFDVKCELSKNNQFRDASIEPHLYLYKIYLIDAHTFKVLTWITGSAKGDLPDASFCKPISAYKKQDLNDLHYTVMDLLKKNVNKDLIGTLGI